MACLLCGAEDAAHRIVDTESESVEGMICAHCADRHLRSDEWGPTCELCSELGEYDLATVENPNGGEPVDAMDDLDLVAQNVLCKEDLEGLRDNAPDPL